MNTFTIISLITYDEEFLCKCITYLYQQQEDDEQSDLQTHHTNGHGFNKSDSPLLSTYAQSLEHGSLSPAELKEAAARLKKYSGQLLKAYELGLIS